MGPSSFDIEISSLCYGMHDLEDCIPRFLMHELWLKSVHHWSSRRVHLIFKLLQQVVAGLECTLTCDKFMQVLRMLSSRQRTFDIFIFQLITWQCKFLAYYFRKVEQTLIYAHDIAQKTYSDFARQNPILIDVVKN
jgi:hypothetical protein